MVLGLSAPPVSKILGHAEDTIEGVDCFLGFGVIAHLDEPETSGLAGVAVSHDLDLSNGAVRFKERTDRLFIRPQN